MPLTLAHSAESDQEYLERLLEEARARRLHETREWHALLHYRRTLWGGVRSEADGMGFFLAGRAGKREPKAELEATLRAFAAPSVPEPASAEESRQHPQCRFPARWSWLKAQLRIDADRWPDQPCPLFATWRQAISAERVTLVYASAYLNSPASMYGHTFLRLSRSTGEGNPLLDYIVNFAADNDTTNGLVYAAKGVFGGFRGHFYVMPFYVKIQEYSNLESRDLWEYELTLTRAESERLVEHAWETRSTHFDYYFFTENCSYFLLSLLEAARPSLRLAEAFSGAVIPADTVRAILDVPGLVHERRPRPALLALLRAHKRALDGRDLARVEALAWRGRAAADQLEGLPPERAARVLEAAEVLLRYRTEPRDQLLEPYKRREREILVLRGRTGVPARTEAARPDVAAPEEGHATSRVGLEGGTTDGASGRSPFLDLSLRGSLHDFLDDDHGYAADTQLEMGHLQLRFEPERRRVFLNRLDALHIVSAVPYERWLAQPSWRVWVGADRTFGRPRRSTDARDSAREGWDSLFGGVHIGGGMALGLRRWLLAYGTLESDLGAGPGLAGGYRIGLAGRGALVVRPTTWWSLEGTARYGYYVLGDRERRLRATAAQAFSLGRHVQLRVRGMLDGDYREASVGLHAYF